MRKSTLGWLVLLGAIGMIGAGLAVRADAQELAPGRFGGQMGAQMRAQMRALRHYAAHWDDAAPAIASGQVVAYGADPMQTLEFWPAAGSATPGAKAPLVLFVHGGAWSRGNRANATGRWKAKALAAGGSAVEVDSFPGQGLLGHIEINRRLGEPGYEATANVDDWLKRVFAG